jgi:hypothetical protein
VKISGYCPVHYGVSYLRQSVEAIAPHVDRLVVAYTPQPSYGQTGGLACPETEEQLRACCDGVGSKLHWMTGIYGSEGQHRNAAIAACGNADLIATADADEIWDHESLIQCVCEAADSSAARFLIDGFVHFWRSFDRCCRDVWGPVRIIKPGGSGDKTIKGTVYHLGYSQSEALVSYKWTCHGHKQELRPEWWSEIFLKPERTRDLHPVVKDWWNAEPFDKTTLPESLKNHENYGKLLIR